METTDLIAGLPGEVLVRQGLADWHSGRPTPAACLIDIARPRLTAVGLVRAGQRPAVPDAELELYRLLRQEGGDSYARYNALIRELVSFEQALDLRWRKARGGAG